MNQTHRLFPLFYSLALLLPLSILIGCQSLPDFLHASSTFQYKGELPRIVDADGPLPPAKVKAIIARLNKDASSDLLGRQTFFIETVTGIPLTGGNRAVLLRDGPETFAAMEKAIIGARDHINVETFIFRDDEVGRRISKLLIEKSKQGVTVNLIYDSWGAKYTAPEFFSIMRGFGINALELNPLDNLGLAGGWNINNRDHRKILVVDGKVAFTGGINFYRGYSGSSITGPAREELNMDFFWRDMHVQLEGPVVAEFQKLFIRMWDKHGEYPIRPANYFPVLRNKGDLLVRVLASSPDEPLPDIYAGYVSAILNAKRSIYITNAYFTPDGNFLDALSAAADKGVDVRIILPSFSDLWLPFHAGRSNYSRLLKAGVRIYEMQGDLLHSKTAVIDGVWSTVGSSNLTLRSFMHDAEVNAVMIGTETGKKMEEIFYMDMANSREITLEQWEKRPLRDRLKESVTRLFRYFL